MTSDTKPLVVRPEVLGSGPGEASAETFGPSSLYFAWPWRLGQLINGFIPRASRQTLARLAAGLYGRCNPARMEVLCDNLRPALKGGDDPSIAAKRLLENFCLKLSHLWDYESGRSLERYLLPPDGASPLSFSPSAGTLIVTVHLGNWEFGAPYLVQHGIEPYVITLEEPDPRLTRLRQRARGGRRVHTLVIGNDPFSFLEVIKKLQEGKVVALLMDRPPKGSSTRVELFGKAFHASVAAAELARATGCDIVPVVMPFTAGRYRPRILQKIIYDRPSLRSKETRDALTQQIISVFEPAIAEYIEQWYHFIPIWPKA